MSNQTRRLHGELEGDQRVVSMMGELTVDLRDAKLEGKPALLELVAVMGNIIVLVPPGAGVDVKGPVLFGNLRQRLSPLSSSSPKIRLRTKVFMGNVEIVECRSSESVKQAKRRHRVESKAVEGAKRRAIAEKSQG